MQGLYRDCGGPLQELCADSVSNGSNGAVAHGV